MTRVRFRKKFGREPTEQEAKEFYHSGRHKTTTPEEVAEAYDKGEEVRMCGYVVLQVTSIQFAETWGLGNGVCRV